ATVTVNIQAVNDAPKITSGSISGQLEIGASQTFSFSAEDVDNQSLNWTATSQSSAVQVQASGSGKSCQVTVTANQESQSPVTITVKVDDGNLSDSRSGSVTVKPKPNTAPELRFSPPLTPFVPRDGLLELSISRVEEFPKTKGNTIFVKDPDQNQNISFSAASNSAILRAYASNSAVFIGLQDQEFNGTEMFPITVTANDGSGQSNSTCSITINVQVRQKPTK
ncbi:MAG: hypothetical protein JW795_06085, partial [Chitinivibrionales bacterium]|nr:hypothetical protein [Chitinivibrionales bacterium]